MSTASGNGKKKVTTEEKALCTYLKLRHEHNPSGEEEDKGYDLQDILEHLGKIDRDNDYIYGFSFYGDPYSVCVQSAIQRLLDVDYIEYSPENPHVKLTEAGHWFGDLFAFDKELQEDLIRDFRKLQDNNGKK